MNHGSDARLALSWRAVWLLALATVAIRLPALRDLPVFGDEAIHVHWSQLVAEDPARFAFVSMQDPKPPFHFWLIALALPLFSDPIRAGRIVSALSGGLSVPLLFGVVVEFRRRFRRPEPAGAAGLAACVLAVLCPFAAFYQRLALAESLFLCESLAAAALALRMASRPSSSRGVVARGAGFGTVLGIAMLTRQNFSYALWALPLLAFACLPPEERSGIRAFAASLAVAGGCALLLWGPLLLQPTGPGWRVRIFHVGAYREALSWPGRVANAGSIASWLWLYLTPPVLFFCVCGLVLLAASRGLRACAFLCGWAAIVLAPLALFATVLFSRYTFTAVAPLWVAGGVFAACLATRLGALVPARLYSRAIAVGLAVVILAWPARDLWRQLADWRSTTLSPPDRWQYVTGWPAGFATEGALAWIRDRAAASPLVLVTPDVSGNPGDAAQVLLRKNPRIALFSASHAVGGPVLLPAPAVPESVFLSGDLRRMTPPAAVRLPGGTAVYFLAPDPFLTRAGWRAARPYFEAANPGSYEAARFENPVDGSGAREAIVVFRLR